MVITEGVNPCTSLERIAHIPDLLRNVAVGTINRTFRVFRKNKYRDPYYGILTWVGSSSTVLESRLIYQKAIFKVIFGKIITYSSSQLLKDFRVLNIRKEIEMAFLQNFYISI